MRSSSSLEELDGLGLEGCGDSAGSGLSLGDDSVVELVEGDLLLLCALQQVHLDRVVVVHEQPATGVDEQT